MSGKQPAAAASPVLGAAPRGCPDVRPPALPKGNAERCPAVRAVRAAVGVGKAATRLRAARGRGSGPPSRAVTCVPAVSNRQGGNESSCVVFRSHGSRHEENVWRCFSGRKY